METHIVKILSVENVTHNVRSYKVQKPYGYTFVPGQATEVAINKDRWKNERRPFTFTGLNEWPHLEFTVKSYFDHDGVTNALYHLQPGDELIIHDVWGAIHYTAPGCFIAGGAGITPFIAIFRDLFHRNAIKGNTLFFSNKTSEDIILRNELDTMLGNNVHQVLTKEDKTFALKGPIDKAFLEKHITGFSKPFYICGPDKMVADISEALKTLGAKPDVLVFEK